MDPVFRVTGVTVGGFTKEIAPAIEVCGNTVRLVVRREVLCNPRFETLRIESSLTTAHAGDAG